MRKTWMLSMGCAALLCTGACTKNDAQDKREDVQEAQQNVQDQRQDVNQAQNKLAQDEQKLQQKAATGDRGDVRDAQGDVRDQMHDVQHQRQQLGQAEQKLNQKQAELQTTENPKVVSGRVLSASDDVVRVQSANGALALQLDGDTKVLRNGQSVSTSQLQAGDQVRAAYRLNDGKRQALSIQIESANGAQQP